MSQLSLFITHLLHFRLSAFLEKHVSQGVKEAML